MSEASGYFWNGRSRARNAHSQELLLTQRIQSTERKQSQPPPQMVIAIVAVAAADASKWRNYGTDSPAL